MLKLSGSIIGDYFSCKLRFIFSQIKKIEPERKVDLATAFGGAIHKTIEIFYKAKIWEKCLEKGNAKPLTDIWRGVYLSHLANEKVDLRNPDIYDPKSFHSIDAGWPVLQNFYSVQNEMGWLKEPQLVEDRFEVAYNEKVTLRGTIDLAIDDYIIDFKTHRQVIPLEKLRNNFQCVLYPWAFEKKFGRPAKTIFFIFLRYGKQVSVPNSFMSESRIQEVVSEIQEFVDNPKEEPNTGSCYYCGYINVCKFFNNNKKRSSGIRFYDE